MAAGALFGGWLYHAKINTDDIVNIDKMVIIQMAKTGPYACFFRLCLLVGLICALPAKAKAGELVSVRAQSTAPAEYRAPVPITTIANTAAVEAAIPLQVRDSTYLVPGGKYRLEAPRFVNPPPGSPPVPLLHDVELSFAVVHQFNEKWSLGVRASAGLAGDLHVVDAGVVRVMGSVLATRQISHRFAFGFGAAADYSFGQLLPLPLIKLEWEPRDTVRLEALLPLKVRLAWMPIQGARVGAFADIEGNEFAIRRPSVRDSPPCSESTASAECWDHLASTDGRLGLFAGAELHPSLWLELRAGLSAYRRFELLNEDNEPVSDGDQRLPAAPFAIVNLSYEY